MATFHDLPPDLLVALADGSGDAGTVDLLWRARYSSTLLMACHLVGDDPRLADVVAAVSHAQRVSAAEAAATLTYPWVCSWAADACRRRLTPGDRVRLRALAVAACLRAGVRELPMDVAPDADGSVLLPSLGRLAVPAESPVRIVEADLQGPFWSPIRRLDLDLGVARVRMTVDDLDPWRACHGQQVADRLDPATWNRWRALLVEAWRLLSDNATVPCAELAAGLASVVPLPVGDLRSSVSVTHSDAFGGFAASLPPDAAALAAVMVHEFQHSKLNVILDLTDLHIDDGRRYFAPWRPDPRPLGGLLHGVYAFLAVAEFWHALRTSPEWEERATRTFARLRGQVSRVLPDLAAAPGLTDDGRRFVTGLAARLSRLGRHDVPPYIERHTTRRLNAIERRWRDRHRAVMGRSAHLTER